MEGKNEISDKSPSFTFDIWFILTTFLDKSDLLRLREVNKGMYELVKLNIKELNIKVYIQNICDFNISNFTNTE